METLSCTNCGGWEYEPAVELGKGSGYWLNLRGAPQAIGFGPPKHFCSMRCVAEFADKESKVLG